MVSIDVVVRVSPLWKYAGTHWLAGTPDIQVNRVRADYLHQNFLSHGIGNLVKSSELTN